MARGAEARAAMVAAADLRLLTAQLRTARRMRRPKSHNAKSGQGHILDMASIRERPAEIEDRDTRHVVITIGVELTRRPVKRAFEII